ncbi:MAG: HEAT repeat domain-containing protein [Cyanobacteria bacterium P01_H01_bin.15]
MLPDSPDTAAEPFLSPEEAISNLQGDDLGLRIYAAWWLGRFRVKRPEVVSGLIAALKDSDDRTPNGGYPLRRNAARSLGKLEDLQAVKPLIDSLSSTDFYVREAAAQSLEMLGSKDSMSPLLSLLRNEIASDYPAPEPPNLSQPYDAILEALGTLGATEAIDDIVPFLEHPVERIQFSAARALYQLASGPDAAQPYAERLIEALQNDSLQLRRVALADLGVIGYLPAAQPIANTLAENSLKLISLRGLVEGNLQEANLPTLDPDSVQVMELMDQLL